ncbi:MAG: hypothetical protein JST46_16870 [Bacteroidetes bacterium]|nr:hypothetical protein [Bacteroidota bacterium]
MIEPIRSAHSIFLTIAIILASSFGIPCKAQNADSVLTVREQCDLFILYPYVDMLKDPNRSLNLDMVRERDSSFRPVGQDIYPTHQDKDVDGYWLRFRVNNLSGGTLKDVLYFHPSIDSIHVYLILPDGKIQSSLISSLIASSKRPLHLSQELALPVDLPAGETTFYLCVVTRSLISKQLGNIILNLAERDTFVNFFLRMRHYHGIALGILMVMTIFHVFVFIFFRGKTYMYFSINLGIVVIYLALQKYYQAEIAWLEPLYSALRYVHDPAGSLVSLTVLLFTQSFLRTYKDDLLMHRIMNGVAVLLVINTLLLFFLVGLYVNNIISIYLGLLSTLLVTIASLRSFLKGNRYALYVFFGYLLFLMVPVVYLIPMPGYMHYKNNESDYHYFAEAIRCLIFAIGIADQFNGVRKAGIRAEEDKERLEVEKAGQLQSERERISRELHDNFGSRITNLGLAMGRLEPGPAKSQRITDLQDQLEQVMIELRNTIWVIEKNEIRADDLEMKIRNMIWQFQKPNEHIRFDFAITANPDQTLTATQAVNILRVLQEAIHNSIRHGKPANINITLHMADHECILTCDDDGVGFNAQEQHGAEHFGLVNMKKRAEFIGGSISFAPVNGKGASVRMSFPVTG